MLERGQQGGVWSGANPNSVACPLLASSGQTGVRPHPPPPEGAPPGLRGCGRGADWEETEKREGFGKGVITHPLPSNSSGNGDYDTDHFNN